MDIFKTQKSKKQTNTKTHKIIIKINEYNYCKEKVNLKRVIFNGRTTGPIMLQVRKCA